MTMMMYKPGGEMQKSELNKETFDLRSDVGSDHFGHL